jgi:hypothetical protein
VQRDSAERHNDEQHQQWQNEEGQELKGKTSQRMFHGVVAVRANPFETL